jgi:hypothetical protein
MAQESEDERGPTPEDAASQAREGHVGRMSPIDPSAGPGGTTAEAEHSDVASGGSGTTEWSGGEVTTGRAGIVDPDVGTVPLQDIRNEVRDPAKAYGADAGMADTPPER